MNFFKRLNADAIIHVFPNREIAVLARNVNIPLRAGTSHRIFQWTTCNKLINFSPRKSDLHEAQLDLKLLAPFRIKNDLSLNELQKKFGFSKVKPLSEKLASLLDREKFNLILHPQSQGNAREWRLDNFSELVRILPEDQYKIFVTGTGEEGSRMLKFFLFLPHVINLTWKLSLDELISFIAAADGLVAASTGPLHLAAVLGEKSGWNICSYTPHSSGAVGSYRVRKHRFLY